MSIKRTTIEGSKIICEIESSNLKTTEYDSDSKKLMVEFGIKLVLFTLVRVVQIMFPLAPLLRGTQ